MAGEPSNKVYMEQGGDKLVVASGGEIDMKTGAKLLTNGTQGANVAGPAAAASLTTDLTGVDTGTDMTAAQAAQIEADLAALKTAIDANNAAIDSILARLEAAGILASS
jgi:hypothetical protein